jgi:hypothetical protein
MQRVSVSLDRSEELLVDFLQVPESEFGGATPINVERSIGDEVSRSALA